MSSGLVLPVPRVAPPGLGPRRAPRPLRAGLQSSTGHRPAPPVTRPAPPRRSFVLHETQTESHGSRLSPPSSHPSPLSQRELTNVHLVAPPSLVGNTAPSRKSTSFNRPEIPTSTPSPVVALILIPSAATKLWSARFTNAPRATPRCDPWPEGERAHIHHASCRPAQRF